MTYSHWDVYKDQKQLIWKATQYYRIYCTQKFQNKADKKVVHDNGTHQCRVCLSLKWVCEHKCSSSRQTWHERLVLTHQQYLWKSFIQEFKQTDLRNGNTPARSTSSSSEAFCNTSSHSVSTSSSPSSVIWIFSFSFGTQTLPATQNRHFTYFVLKLSIISMQNYSIYWSANEPFK